MKAAKKQGGISIIIKKEYRFELTHSIDNIKYQALVLAVAYNEFKTLELEALKISDESVVYDIKGIWDKEKVDGRL